MYSKLALASLFLRLVQGQGVGTYTAETHPTLTSQTCTKSGCTNSNTKIVLDANWRWTHKNGDYTNCYTGNTWDATLCPDGATCAKNCVLEGADYTGTYGITASGNSLKLNFVTSGTNKNVGSRVYLMKDDNTYQTFNLLNKEFTFDVDVSNLPCGLNGAVYFSAMDADGGKAKYATNTAGAKYGTGYCDSQCPRDVKYINGKANSDGWAADSNSANSGKGNTGSCCDEMDIWEANSISEATTPHPCTSTGLQSCTGAACGTSDRYATVCDPDGCDFNPYRLGNQSYYGKGKTVDTSSKFTLVTQFITADGTNTGTLSAIRRIYVQNGKVIQNAYTNVAGIDTTNQITGAFCDQAKAAFGDNTDFQKKGGLAKMGKALQNMVLVLSLWDDYAVNMLWLDSTYPTTGSGPGYARGTCSTSSGVPADVESQNAGSSVTYSNIKFGDLNTTYTAN
ncbi:MAG: Exoglucanase [Bogoriella megaspora]|nr:MAG: Exoglucanase [Bogoriella megaspora]